MTDLTPAAFWLTAGLAGLGTFLLRSSFILFAAHREPAPWLARALRYVPPAVLAALVLPAVLRAGGAFSPLRPETLAAVVAAVVAWRTRNMLATIATGMVVLWLTRVVTG